MYTLNAKGRIIWMSEIRSGISQAGKQWSACDYVIEEDSGQFPSRVTFTVFGDDNLRKFNIQIGDYLEVSLDVNSREYNGKFYNSIKAFNAQRIAPPQPYAPERTPTPPPTTSTPTQQTTTPPPSTAPHQQPPSPPVQQSLFDSKDSVNDLPF